jgi:hypothetical protein
VFAFLFCLLEKFTLFNEIFLVAILIYVKYRQTKEILSIYNFSDLYKLNKVSSCAGYMAAVGVTIVANFQETNAFIFHFIGALIAFGCGAVYQCSQVFVKINLYFLHTLIFVEYYFL